MDRIGTITFQSNESSDVFYVADVYEAGIEQTDENLIGIPPMQFEGVAAWVTGRVPKMTPVNIEGDTAVIHGWFKGGVSGMPYRLSIYIEYELVEELLPGMPDEREQGEPGACDESQEIIL